VWFNHTTFLSRNQIPSSSCGGGEQLHNGELLHSNTIDIPAVADNNIISVALPTVAVPTVAVPTVAVPTVAVPTVAVPTVAVPTVAVPTVAVPTVAILTVAILTVAVPTVAVPTVAVPTVAIPTVAILTVAILTVAIPAAAAEWRDLPVLLAVLGISNMGSQRSHLIYHRSLGKYLRGSCTLNAGVVLLTNGLSMKIDKKLSCLNKFIEKTVGPTLSTLRGLKRSTIMSYI
jgi:hypothetical protein